MKFKLKLSDISVQFANELDAWLRDRFNYRSRFTYAGLGDVVVAKRVKVDLYLRLVREAPQGAMWPAKTLVIARMRFRDRRRGHGRALLQFLVGNAQRYGYEHIAVENTTEGAGIQAFCSAFFHDHPASLRRDTNWIALVTHLESVLDSKPKTMQSA